MTTRDLAKLALEVLDAQQTFFKCKDPEPKRSALIASKMLEVKLRKSAQAILSEPEVEPDDAEVFF